MSNDKNVRLGIFLIELNQLITEFEFFHWLTLTLSLRQLLMSSKMTLLTLPSSLFVSFDGLIRRHLGLDSKLSLWSFKVMNAGVFAIMLIRSPTPKLLEMPLSSSLISSATCSFPDLYMS